MKKNWKKIFIVAFVMFFSLTLTAKAEDYYIPTNIGTGYNVGGLPISKYKVNKIGDNSFSGYAFCMAPGKTAGTSASHTNARYIITGTANPTSSEYDLALTYAYTKLAKDGHIKLNSQPDMEYVSTLFRLVSDYYGQLDRYSSNNKTIADAAMPYIVENGKIKNKSRWSNNAGTQYIWSAFEETINAVKGSGSLEQKYKKLIDSNKLWEPKWEFKLVSQEPAAGKNRYTLKIEVSASRTSKFNQPSKINWKNFKVECKHGYNCAGVKVDAASDDANKAYISLVVNTSNGDEEAAKKDNALYGIYITTSYIDIKDAHNRIKFMKPVSVNGSSMEGSIQKMILLDTGNVPGSDTIPLQIDKQCVCEVDEKDGKKTYTGYYIYTDTTGGNNKTIRFKTTNKEKAEKYNCTEKCDNPEPTPNCEIKDNQFYGKEELHPDGQPVDEATYRKECLHSCQTPDESGDGKYYCKESEEGKGDGVECTAEEYEDECLCPVLKDKCDSNPNDPACQEFDEKCTNCNPTMSLPTDCNDFDVESEFKGIVSDINQIESECNPKVDQIKKCVLDSKDLTGESFEATAELSDNPYCKVWCKETYNFTVPTAKYSTSGGYFTLKSTIEGQRDCYVGGATHKKNAIDKEKFDTDFATAEASIKSAYDNYISVKGNKDSTDAEISEAAEAIQKAKENLESIVKKYNACTDGWTNSMNFNPELNFSYNEDYMNIMNGKFEETEKQDEKITDIYCTGDVDSQYKCTSGAVESSSDDVPSSIYEDKKYTTCDTSGCKETTIKISKAKWVQKTKNNGGTYEPKNNFQTYTQYGTIKIKSDKCEGRDCLWTRLPDSSLPVALKTGAGVFPFKFTYNNVGQSNNNNEDLGRLIGKDNSVLVSFANLPDGKKCSVQEDGKDVKASVDGGYVCHYLNDCDDCTFECEGDDCTFTDEDDDDELKCQFKNGKYYDNEGNVTTKEDYKQKCSDNDDEEHKCVIIEGQFYDAEGNIVSSEEEFKASCKICEDGNCDLICDDEGNCYFHDPENPDTPDTPTCENGVCNVKCDTCIFDGNQQTYKFRTVSLNNLFPNSCEVNSTGCREEGYNWNSTTKAIVTKKEIADAGENIYNEPEYSYTITSEQQQNIRSLNKSLGSYSNSTYLDGSAAMKCDQITYDNVIYYAVNCTSAFLDDNTGHYFTENKRNTEFTLWSENSEYCPNATCLSRKDGIGPSWK